MHLVENLFLLALDIDALRFANGGKAVAEFAEWDVAVVYINDHHHREEILKDGLIDVEDINIVFCEVSADSGDDAYCVFANYGDYGAVHRGGY